jgi:hypothetical protein
MALLILAFLGGILTIISPCILPVLPFVFSRADQPFRKSGLPLLAGIGPDFRGAFRAGDRGRRVDRSRESARSRCIPCGAGDLWTDAGLARTGRSGLAPIRKVGKHHRELVDFGRSRREAGRHAISAARRRHRTAVGSVRRADSWLGPDRRRHRRSQYPYRRSLTRLRDGCGDLACRCAAGGRSSVRRAQAIVRSGSSDSHHPGDRCPGRRGCHCLWSGPWIIDETLARQHLGSGTNAD